jgi:ribosome biogenesis protein Tsr3
VLHWSTSHKLRERLTHSTRCRDSGSKLRRMGFSGSLRIGQSFSGVVLSSEATIIVSKQDAEIISTHGIAGINCSWNRCALLVCLYFYLYAIDYVIVSLQVIGDSV